MEEDKDSHDKAREARRRRDSDDLANETAGREVGRQYRFLPETATRAATKKKRQREREKLSALMLLMQNAAYAALFNDTMEQVRRADAASEAALARAIGTRDQAKARLHDGRSGASTLPDGTRVYLDRNGDALTEDGMLLGADEHGSVVWRDGAIGYEEYLARKKALDDAQQTVDAIRRYQTDVLGHARDRLSDEDNPPTMDELRDIQQAIRAAPQAVKDAMPSPEQGDLDAARTSTLDAKLPPIGR